MSKKINTLLIMMDQLRFDSLGYSSNGLVETPTVDWLASMGTIFSNAYTPAPSCIPARASLMTGKSPWNTGVLFTGNSAGPHRVGGTIGVNFEHTLAGDMVKNGYHSEGIGKMHFFPQRASMGFSHTLIDESGREEDKNFISDYKEWYLKCNPNQNNITDHGVHWNSWMARPFHLDECYHPSNWTANCCLEYLVKRDPSMPFFLNMSFSRPHSPYDPSEYFFNLYKEKQLPKPFKSEWSKKYGEKPQSILAWKGALSDEQCERQRAGYYGSITQTDYQIAKILTTLNKAKLLDEMLIIFTSDHGDMLDDHNLLRKTYAYEGSSHIPLIIKLPKSMSENAMKIVDEPVSLIDILPTIFEVCGIEIPSEVDGVSLMDAIKGKKLSREYVVSEHTEAYNYKEDNIFVTDGKFKFIWRYKANKEMFFDLRENKCEENDEIDNPNFASQINDMRNYLICELEKRNCDNVTFVKDGKLQVIDKDKFIVSPNYTERLESSLYNWLKENNYC